MQGKVHRARACLPFFLLYVQYLQQRLGKARYGILTVLYSTQCFCFVRAQHHSSITPQYSPTLLPTLLEPFSAHHFSLSTLRRSTLDFPSLRVQVSTPIQSFLLSLISFLFIVYHSFARVLAVGDFLANPLSDYHQGHHYHHPLRPSSASPLTSSYLVLVVSARATTTPTPNRDSDCDAIGHTLLQPPTATHQLPAAAMAQRRA